MSASETVLFPYSPQLSLEQLDYNFSTGDLQELSQAIESGVIPSSATTEATPQRGSIRKH